MKSELISQLENHRHKLLNFIKTHISETELAEDILQDSLLKALKAAPDLKDEDKLLPWFYKILKNSIIDVYRRKGSNSVDIDKYENTLNLMKSQDFTDDKIICSCFYELLPGLKPEYAELIKRIDLNGETSKMVSSDLNISFNNLKVRHYRARQALRQRLMEACRFCAEHHCLDCSCSKK